MVVFHCLTIAQRAVFEVLALQSAQAVGGLYELPPILLSTLYERHEVYFVFLH